MQELIRDWDTVARLGGDEFLVVLANLEAESDAKLIAKRILKAVGASFVNDGVLLNVTCSIGVACRAAAGSVRIERGAREISSQCA